VLVSRFVVACAFVGLALAGCAKPPSPIEVADASVLTNSIGPVRSYLPVQPMPKRIFATRQLGGRTLAVASTSEIVLQPGEVVLTFDDGPRPGRTDAILSTLDTFNVKATFLMLGSAAQAHPRLAQRVALSGHTVGSHTFGHVDLSTLGRQEAVDEIARGERAVAAALAPSGQTLSPFFRFPYLSQTGFLRTSMLQGNIVVLDVDIDSKDYYKDTPEVVAARTLDRLEARGSGVILFHDIHERTVDLLPSFLEALAERGYSVVRLVPKNGGIFARDLVTAEAPASAAVQSSSSSSTSVR
jgi:peptidoglycan/xylan/chitin deacetylase (PgdA/CDA1 family)